MGRKRKEEEPPAGAPAWMATYSDMMTLLLCFFVLLFSFATLDVQKFQAIAHSMSGSLGVLDSGITVNLEPLVTSFPSDSPVEEAEEFRIIYEQMSEYIKENNLEASITLRLDERGLLVTFLDDVLFDSGKADLKPKAREIINKVAEIIRRNNKNVRVEGHTDNVPINTFRFPSNWELSTTRAVNVVKYLIEENGIEAKRMSASGYSDQHPVDDNNTKEGRQKNRRVDMVILRDEKNGTGK
ncbi:MAG TPA: OmpA family protein [Bacillota bacterium]|nr:OmpA family protein [Bacillota bacterium]HOR86714.1 OmpA family protein [Bacillota bacterium]HPL53745.1 OmpA family protein [Bacillota bacterium]